MLNKGLFQSVNQNQSQQILRNTLQTNKFSKIINTGMRFILIYKYGILQTKTERIDVNFCETSQQLLDYLQKRVGQAAQNFIARIKKGKVSYRLLPGWSITHYGLKEGMELNIELLEQFKPQKEAKVASINTRYLNNILGFEQQQNGNKIQEIAENQNQDEEEETAGGEFNVRKYLDQQCEKMLGAIQKKNLQSFLDIFQDYPENIDEDSLLEIQNKKPFLIDELGEKGWGALHYAIFCKAADIFEELLQMDVDVNKCTSDGWLPIQLAIDLKDRNFITKLLAEPTINLNLVTSRGTPLHTVAKEGLQQILVMLLDKDVDISLKDNSGKTAMDLCSDSYCLNLMKKYQDKKETYQEYVKGNMPLSLTTIVRGAIMKAKRPFMALKQRYLLIDPFQGSMIRYQSIANFPKKPIEITPLNNLKGMRIVQDSEKAFYMKKQYVYFQIDEPNKELYACRYKETAQKWITNIKLAVKFAQELQKNPQIISDIKRNELIIEDKEHQMEALPKKVKKNVFNMTLSYRNSTGSIKSTDNDRKSVVRTQKTKPQIPPAMGQQNFHSKDDNPNLSKRPSTSQDEPEEDRKANLNYKKQSLAAELNQITTNKVSFSSFNIMHTLGSGAFGKVFLAKLISNGHLYALKALKKKNLILQKQLKYAIMEANILKQANHIFIINLHFAFQTPHYLYLCLDYCPGRDLSFHLAREVTFPQDQAKFYIAELCLAIEHLHQKNIIYRDLKPENILLDAAGHVKLADFGLSKQTNDDKTKSFCGSPAYLSPEMLNQKGAGKESDLYGIGAVLYQFLIGQPPYFSDDIPTLYRNIKEGKLKFPKNVSENAKIFIIGLLERDPKKRLGAKSWSQIKDHPFFQTIDWDKLVKLQIKPPERPEMDDDEGSEDELDIIKNPNVSLNLYVFQTHNFTDFDYDDSTKKINRLMNFSFIRPE